MKTITKQQWLEAFAFYTLARQHHDKTRQFELAMLRAIDHRLEHEGYGNQLSDAIYDNAHDHLEFDEMLKIEGYIVESPLSAPPARPMVEREQIKSDLHDTAMVKNDLIR